MWQLLSGSRLHSATVLTLLLPQSARRGGCCVAAVFVWRCSLRVLCTLVDVLFILVAFSDELFFVCLRSCLGFEDLFRRIGICGSAAHVFAVTRLVVALNRWC